MTGTAIADTTPEKHPNTVYQLSALDKAIAAPLQIMKPTVPTVMTEPVLLNDLPVGTPTGTSDIGSTDGETSEPELLNKTTLSPGISIDGLACNILHTPVGKHRWSILQYDLSIDTDNQKAVFVSDEDTTIQSVSCSADGSQVLMAIQDGVNGDSEIYLIDQTNNEILRLTDNDTEDLDVSMSRDGKIMSWQGRLADDRQAVFIRMIAEDGSYSDVALGSKFPMTQPSLSDNGEWLILVNERNRYDHILRYQLSTGEFTTVKTVNSNRYEVANPSISNNGTKVLWTEDDDSHQDLILVNLELGSRALLLRKYHPTKLTHPYLSADGEAVIYSVNREKKQLTYLRVLKTGQTIRVGKVLHGEAQYLGSQTQLAVDIELYKLNVEETDGGSVSVNPTSEEGYLPGTIVTLTAAAASGFELDAWVGMEQCYQQLVCSFTMPTQDLSITVSFKEDKGWVKLIGKKKDDYIIDMVKGADNFLYVAGITTGKISDQEPLGGGSDVFIGKYDEDGNEQWIKQFGTSSEDGRLLTFLHFGKLSITSDDQGGVYIAGTAGGSLFVAKYDTEGNQLWFSQPAHNDWVYYWVSVFDLVSSSGGGVYVVGYSNSDFADADMILSELDGYTSGPGFLIHFSADGDHVFTKMIKSTGSKGNMVTSIAMDSLGNIFLGGLTYGTFPGTEQYTGWLYDGFVMKLDPQGDFVWAHILGSTGADFVADISVNDEGDIYAVSQTSGKMGDDDIAGVSDIAVTKIDTDGEILFTKQYGTNGSDSLRGGSSALDREGNLYITWNTSLPWKTYFTGISVMKLSEQGDILYSRAFDSTFTKSWVNVIPSGDSYYLSGYTSSELGNEPKPGGVDGFISRIYLE